MDLTDIPRLLLGSLALRPYVYGFLAVHLVGASALLGWRRMAAFTLITWGVAFVAEHSSIRTGIPFGWYYYIPRTADRELWIGGVPFFDSLSYSFLLAASYGLAWLLLANGPAKENFEFRNSKFEIRISNFGMRRAWGRPGRVRHLILTTLLFVGIDMVIDPVALRGDRWFLGQIYGYPEPGVYFGVPLANFLGWGVVGAASTAVYQAWEPRGAGAPRARLPGRALLCPGLYFIVLAFTLAVTAALGEWRLLLSGFALTLPLLCWTSLILVGSRGLAWRPRTSGAES